MSTAYGDEAFIQSFVVSLQKHEKQLVDNVLTAHPTLELFLPVTKNDTGRGLVVPLRAKKLGVTAYSDDSGSHATTVSPDTIGAAVYNWAKEIITPVRLKHRDILQNTGETQQINLAEEYKAAAVADHKDFLAAALWGSEAAEGELIPLAALISDTVAVGGVDPSVTGKEYWKSTVRYIPKSGTGSMDIKAAFRAVTNDIFAASGQRPTHIVCGRDVYEEFEALLDSAIRYAEVNTAETRFQEIRFGGTMVRLDPDCPTDRAYFIHQPSLRLRYLAGEFMKAYDAQRLEGKLDSVVPLASTLLWGVAERRAFGVLVRDAAPEA